MEVVLLSGYHARSHDAWCQRLEAMFPEWQWHRFELAPRHFSWRVRGSSLAFSRCVPWSDLKPDVLIATSMTDVASLRGMVPELRSVPVILYVHENQFAYPNQSIPKGLVDWQLTSIYSALASDAVVFNSEFNRKTFFEGAIRLFKRLPDYAPLDCLKDLETRSSVIPVPLEDKRDVESARVDALSENPCDIVWNHRWEFDKGPDRLKQIVDVLQQKQIEFRLHVVGEQFRQSPPVFDDIYQQLTAEQRGEWGFLSEDDYLALLSRSHCVLSTAIHDFQGLSVLTGAVYGCKPIVPNRLAYPEWFSRCYESHETSSTAEAESAVAEILNPEPIESTLDALSMTELRKHYETLIRRTVDDFSGETSKN